MQISFPINVLLKKELTADDYTIALLLKEGKFGLLKEYIQIMGNKFYDSFKRLKKLEYIDYKQTIGDIIPLKEAYITDKFLEILNNGDLFEEFYNEYPIKVTRKEGVIDYLRRDKTKCKVKYKKLVKNNLFIHDHIIDCLKYEVQTRTKKGDLAYMKRMYNWLENEEWKIIEEKMLKEKENNNSSTPQERAYGTNLL